MSTSAIPNPSRQQMEYHFRLALEHCCRVEYYALKLGVGLDDPQRPHDVNGENNKFDPRVMPGLALGGEDRLTTDPHFLYALERHRQQYHHRMFNGNTRNPQASEDDLYFGAVDFTSSRLENRPYQDGRHTFKQIRQVLIPKLPKYKQEVMLYVVEKMEKVAAPPVEDLFSLDQLPKIITFLPRNVSDQIISRAAETARLIRDRYKG